jgi:formamidopyrimidine-DNA glycosylase
VPELPEVERGRRIAAQAAEKRRILRVVCRHDEIVFDRVSSRRWKKALTGKTVREVRRIGKQIWFELDSPPHPLFHFGMTGAFRVPGRLDLPLSSRPSPDPHEVWPPRFTKIHLFFDGGSELVMTNARRLGRILLREDPLHQPPISRLGFDPLLGMISPAEFRERAGRRRTAMKNLLLDQSFCAGVGNWIADEVLYQARIDPRRRASELDATELERVRRRLRAVVKLAVKVEADKSRFPADWLFHVRWGKNEKARTLKGNRVEFLQIGGRTSAWVPARQK